MPFESDSRPQESWPQIAVLGAGAVGCYFGGMLARAGAPVTLIGRATHVEAIQRDGLLIESLRFRERISVAASTKIAAVQGADFVLFCVKTLDTEEAARDLVPYLSRNALLVSLQNGVDNVERIQSATGIDAVPAVVYVAAEMSAPGHVKHSGRGDLVMGEPTDRSAGEQRGAPVQQISAAFVRAGVPCVITDNIEGELWAKLLINCAYNAISALSKARYGRLVASAGMREVMRQTTEETLRVGRAAGVRFQDLDYLAAVYKLGEAMSGALSSTAQDLARGKRTEIDSLNGYVARRGAELNVPAPVNQTLHALVKMLEESL